MYYSDPALVGSSSTGQLLLMFQRTCICDYCFSSSRKLRFRVLSILCSTCTNYSYLFVLFMKFMTSICSIIILLIWSCVVINSMQKVDKMYVAFTGQSLEKVQQYTERDRFLSVSEVTLLTPLSNFLFCVSSA